MKAEKADADKIRDLNRNAWNAERYQSWIAAIGAPNLEAKRIVSNPQYTLRRLLPYLGDVAGKTICSVQGSHGRVAVALALLGAELTVIDFSEGNERYALELAAAAGVKIEYRVCDILAAGQLGLDHRFDVIVMELGILHYHLDLIQFFAVLASLSARGGRLVLNEFHPVQRKLFWRGGGAPADYFNSELVVADVPNPMGADRSLGKCTYRFWTLGEIFTAILSVGYSVERLEEHPDWTDPKIPGTFTLVARA